MWRKAALLSILPLGTVLSVAPEASGGPIGLPMVETVPAPSDAVLFTPRMGLYLQHPPLDARADEWYMALSDIAYYRVDWSELNPEAGVYLFDAYFGPRFDVWVGHHRKRVAFRVMCQNMHSRRKYVTPQWIFDRGVPAVVHANLAGDEQLNPAFWDERYLELQAEFVRALGAYLDGRPGLEFVDIGSIGEWGEMHLARWTPQQLADTGYSHTRYVQAYRRMIDAHAAAFPRTLVFLNVGSQANHSINDYAAQRGLHFRQDGLNPAGASYNCGEWLYKPYARRGVICNFEFHSGYREMQRRGWDLTATVERALDAPISYLNTNLGVYRTDAVPDEVTRELRRVARRIGYRFVPARIEHPAVFRLDGSRPARIPLRTAWRNDGIAPCTESLALVWSLVAADGAVAMEETQFPVVPTTQWWPGEEQQVNAVLRVPAATPPGDYRLRVAMVLPETGRRTALGIEGGEADGSYSLCALAGVRADARAEAPFSEGFEGADPRWNAAAGVTAAGDRGAAHGGVASLRVHGTAEGGWNYASHRVPSPLIPGGLYRLTAWMLVTQIGPGAPRPYVKLGVNDPSGKWLTNANSDAYDLGRMGTWQQLTAVCDLPLEAGSVDIAIEKGDPRGMVMVDLRLDDVTIELLEAP